MFMGDFVTMKLHCYFNFTKRLLLTFHVYTRVNINERNNSEQNPACSSLKNEARNQSALVE